MSAITASSQLKATYSSQLYNQQITGIAAFVAQAHKGKDDILGDMTEVDADASHVVGSNGEYAPYEASLVKLRMDVDELDAAGEQLALILPKEFDGILTDISTSSETLGGAIGTKGGVTCQAGSDTESTCSVTDLKSLETQTWSYANKMSGDADKVQACARKVLATGYSLSSQTDSSCDLAPASPPSPGSTIGGGSGGSGG